MDMYYGKIHNPAHCLHNTSSYCVFPSISLNNLQNLIAWDLLCMPQYTNIYTLSVAHTVLKDSVTVSVCSAHTVFKGFNRRMQT